MMGRATMVVKNAGAVFSAIARAGAHGPGIAVSASRPFAPVRFQSATSGLLGAGLVAEKGKISYGLADRVCVVTGGAKGIGEACVRLFAREDAKVVIVDTDEVRGQALAAELSAIYVCCDVGDKAQVDALIAQTLEKHGTIDVLVNNAAIFKSADFLEVTEADFNAVMRVNVTGAFLVGQAAARVMAEKGSGSIINMSSVNGRTAIPKIASYNASKGAIDQLTKVMALALADKGIRVNAVAPGTIATELAAKAVLTSPEAKQMILSRTPLKRLGEPSEVAHAVAWLASDASSYVTGEVLVVDGGRMALNYTVPVPTPEAA